MKHVQKVVMGLVMLVGSFMGFAQEKADNQRMDQDIEVAENILGTLLRQQFGKRGFFPIEVNGSYVPGYGVTFRLPVGGGFNRFMLGGFDMPDMPSTMDVSSNGFSYSYSWSDEDVKDEDCVDCERERARARSSARAPKPPKAPKAPAQVSGAARSDKSSGHASSDSLSDLSNKRFMDVAQTFLADYSEVVSGLKSDERIMITNRSDDFEAGFDVVWLGGRQSKRQLMSVEAKRSDMDQLKQNKITRAEFLKRLTIVNTEPSDNLDPDLEVFSSMFGRLYREDLSKTYYVQGNIGYERLKDFGVVYYMKVYSSMEVGDGRFAIPTIAVRDVSQVERDKRVKELYPQFESGLKENIVEYGRTLRSLKDDEQLVFNVKLTKCVNCNIPTGLELSIKSSALKDYSSGKASKEATMAKINVKKTGVQ